MTFLNGVFQRDREETVWAKESRRFAFMTRGLKRERKNIRNVRLEREAGARSQRLWVLAAWVEGLSLFTSEVTEQTQRILSR